MAAWCDGRLAGGAPSSRSFPAAGPLFKPVSLPALAAVPISALRKFPAALMSRAFNAMTFSKQPGDAFSRHSLQLIGEQLSSSQEESSNAWHKNLLLFPCPPWLDACAQIHCAACQAQPSLTSRPWTAHRLIWML